ncbi:PfkB family carbohydrate kinase [Caproiciproducens sp.]|uniref:PfkB family carbohydrate kinase n=1 Tax=Caproiciproducens sp. TaxID=1954376 RepID=UPI00289F0EED|nr:PfkB family carbohydrate kinase [Caproiciproducens sp.]
MTNREQEIIELIRKNPMITQNELSEMLSITRSSVAVHITNLMKKGVIKGKCYILNDEPYVCVVGGANVDIQGFPGERLVMNDSNPGAVKISFGGVGRNIAENISRLGIQTKLITAVGNDDYGRGLLEAAGKCGMDMKHSLVSDEYPTPIYLSILDEEGDMKVAISQMNVLEKVTPEFIENRRQLIKRAQLCVIDTNLPEKTLAFLTQEFPEMDFYLDTVSTAKAVKVKNILGRLHTIKPNRLEAEKLSDIKITDEDSLRRSGEFFLKQGVRRVVISLGSRGTYYRDRETEFILETEKARVVNATGAGDAFMAGLVYTSLNGMAPVETIRFSAAASKLALSHENTINPDMSVENINKIMEENDHVKRLS